MHASKAYCLLLLPCCKQMFSEISGEIFLPQIVLKLHSSWCRNHASWKSHTLSMLRSLNKISSIARQLPWKISMRKINLSFDSTLTKTWKEKAIFLTARGTLQWFIVLRHCEVTCFYFKACAIIWLISNPVKIQHCYSSSNCNCLAAICVEFWKRNIVCLHHFIAPARRD